MIGAAGTFVISTAASPPVTAITLTGTLPAGVTFTDNGNGTATLAGTPTAGPGGPYALIFSATNGVGAPVTQASRSACSRPPPSPAPNARAFTVGFADSFTVTTDGMPMPR